MNLIETISDIPLNSPVKILVYKRRAQLASFMTKVTKQLDADSIPGIEVKTVYLQDKPVKLQNFTIILQYRGVDNRDYFFGIQNTICDYEHGYIQFYSSKKAKVHNKRHAYRFSCNYRIVVHMPNSSDYFIGHCVDMSYVGIGCYLQDPQQNLQVGATVYLDIFSDEQSVEHLPGRISRIKTPADGTTNIFAGIQIKTEIPAYNKMIQQLQYKMLQASHSRRGNR